MFSFLFGLVGSIIALIGWFKFHSVLLLIIGTILYIVETVIEWQSLNSNAKKVDVAVFIIGALIAAFATEAPWYVGGMIAIAIYSLIISIFSIAQLFKMRF